MTDHGSSLARSLVDAAAEALHAAGFVDPDDDTVPVFHSAEDQEQYGRISVWVSSRQAAAVAVGAALKALADSYPNEADTNATPEDAVELYRLATEVRQSR